jgi:hypothetical protein
LVDGLFLEVTSQYSGNNRCWKCQCDCGTIKVIGASSLTTGQSKSCGCLHRELSKLRQSKPEFEASKNALYARYKCAARKRNITFNISLEDFIEIAKQDCFYCGIGAKQEIKDKNYNGIFIHNGIDRINSSLGYSKENCVSCCKQCNFAKLDYTHEEFLEWLDRAYNHSVKKRKSIWKI